MLHVNALLRLTRIPLRVHSSRALSMPALIQDPVDEVYPGTATSRLMNVVARVKQLTEEELSAPWQSVRKTQIHQI